MALPRCIAPSRHSTSAQRDRRDGEGEAEHLHQLVLGQPDRLEVGTRRNDEHAGAAGDEPGGKSDDRRQPPFVAARHEKRT